MVCPRHPPPAGLPYAGDDPFWFLSYSHADQDLVMREVGWLQSQGVNLWWDQQVNGRHADVIARKIAASNCVGVLLYYSCAAANSQYVRDEVGYARNVNNKPILPMFLCAPAPAAELHLLVAGFGGIMRHQANTQELQTLAVQLLGTQQVPPGAHAPAVRPGPTSRQPVTAARPGPSLRWLSIGHTARPIVLLGGVAAVGLGAWLYRPMADRCVQLPTGDVRDQVAGVTWAKVSLGQCDAVPGDTNQALACCKHIKDSDWQLPAKVLYDKLLAASDCRDKTKLNGNVRLYLDGQGATGATELWCVRTTEPP